MDEIPINNIIVLERDRKDYGDLEELADSIQTYGLIEPIVVNQDNQLVAGGRRLSACKLLQWQTVPVYRKETLSKAQLVLMETEENVRRKAYNWREEVSAVNRIHNTHRVDALLNHQEWTLLHTAEVIGYSRSYVWNCLDILEWLSTPEGLQATEACETITDAVRRRAQYREDAARAEMVRRTNLQKLMAPAVSVDTIVEALDRPLIDVPQTEVIVSLSDRYFLGDSIDLMNSWPPGSFDHIITDPPYGIDIKMIEQATTGLIDASRIEATHDVKENMKLFETMFDPFYRILKPTGFLILWCDIMHWQDLYELAIEAGFKVQRWPIVWHKLSQCKNQYASLNFTKNIEIAMVCRKESASLTTPIQTCVVASPNDAKRDSNPFAKPYEVWRFLIEAVSHKGQKILDPFAGEGSCILAGLKLLRSMHAIEVDEKHYNFLIENVKTYCKDQFKSVKFV